MPSYRWVTRLELETCLDVLRPTRAEPRAKLPGVLASLPSASFFSRAIEIFCRIRANGRSSPMLPAVRPVSGARSWLPTTTRASRLGVARLLGDNVETPLTAFAPTGWAPWGWGGVWGCGGGGVGLVRGVL